MENLETERTDVKKKSLAGKIFKFFVRLMAFMLILAAGFLLWCKFDSKSVLDVIPRSYSFYLHADSAVDTLESVADIQAMDMLLSAKSFRTFREPFMTYRSSDLRKDAWFRYFANRAVDAAFYPAGQEMNFIAVIDLDYLSGASRFADFILGFVKSDALQDLSFFDDEECPYFVYRSKGASSAMFMAAVKNLVVVSNSLDLLKKGVSGGHSAAYSENEIDLLRSSADGIRLVVKADDLTDIVSGDEIISSISGLFDKESLSVVDFKLSDTEVNVKCSVPFACAEDDESAFKVLLSRKSDVPSILNRTVGNVQYYTFLNAGTLEELKEAVFPLVPESQNIEASWENADSLCESVLGLNLKELLFSWSGSEFAALGIENQNDPVFAIQIKDEKQRQKIFDKITSSILIKEDNSLILGGVRLSKLSLPSFLNWLLNKFDINLPSPYFMVHDGFVYFSESPESLSSIYVESMAGKSIISNANWKSVSSGISNEATVSLYYNLERSLPFFMRRNRDLANILRLYTIGRFDVKVDSGVVELVLKAAARKSGDLRNVPGFPMNLSGKADPDTFMLEKGSNPQSLFWIEDSAKLKLLNLGSMEILSVEQSDSCSIAPVFEPEKDGGVVWCVTSHGTVYVYDRKLEVCENFPLILPGRPSGAPSSFAGGIYVPLTSGSIATVSLEGKVSEIEFSDENVNGRVAVAGDYAAVYHKGFLGNIITLKGGKPENLDNPIFVPEIGFENPALIKTSGKPYVGFISQSGNMYVWQKNSMLDSFPVELEGTFSINCRASEKYFYALSTEAVLYRISLDGSILAVRVPDSTAKNGYLTVSKVDGKYNVFVCADANVIYGFNEDLELLSAFPLVGWGRPVFADVDGDKITECLSLTLDKKLTAWKLR